MAVEFGEKEKKVLALWVRRCSLNANCKKCYVGSECNGVKKKLGVKGVE